MTIDFDKIDPKLLEEDDRIVAYLKGQMSQQEEQEFLKLLKENPELKEKAIATARLVKGLKEVGAEQDKETQDAFLASTEENVETIAKSIIQGPDVTITDDTTTDEPTGEDNDKPNVFPLRKVAGWLSIAASVILIVWLGIGYNNYKHTTGLGDKYYEAFPSSMIDRGGDLSTDAEKKLEKLFNDVKENKNIDDAIHELSLCWELSRMDTYNDYTDYSAEIGWFLAIAHLKDNNKKEAKRTLEKLVSITEEGSIINERAKELLGKL